MLPLDFRNTSAGTLYSIPEKICMIVHCCYRLTMNLVGVQTAEREENTVCSDCLNSQIFFVLMFIN